MYNAATEYFLSAKVVLPSVSGLSLAAISGEFGVTNAMKCLIADDVFCINTIALLQLVEIGHTWRDTIGACERPNE